MSRFNIAGAITIVAFASHLLMTTNCRPKNMESHFGEVMPVGITNDSTDDKAKPSIREGDTIGSTIKVAFMDSIKIVENEAQFVEVINLHNGCSILFDTNGAEVRKDCSEILISGDLPIHKIIHRDSLYIYSYGNLEELTVEIQHANRKHGSTLKGFFVEDIDSFRLLVTSPSFIEANSPLHLYDIRTRQWSDLKVAGEAIFSSPDRLILAQRSEDGSTLVSQYSLQKQVASELFRVTGDSYLEHFDPISNTIYYFGHNKSSFWRYRIASDENTLLFKAPMYSPFYSGSTNHLFYLEADMKTLIIQAL